MGWDDYREVVFANQKEMGIFDADAVLSPTDHDVVPWDSTRPSIVARSTPRSTSSHHVETTVAIAPIAGSSRPTCSLVLARAPVG